MSGFPVTGYKLMVISRGRSFPDGVSFFLLLILAEPC